MGESRPIRSVPKKLYENRRFPVVFLIFLFPLPRNFVGYRGRPDPCHLAKPKIISVNQFLHNNYVNLTYIPTRSIGSGFWLGFRILHFW